MGEPWVITDGCFLDIQLWRPSSIQMCIHGNEYNFILSKNNSCSNVREATFIIKVVFFAVADTAVRVKVELLL